MGHFCLYFVCILALSPICIISTFLFVFGHLVPKPPVCVVGHFVVIDFVIAIDSLGKIVAVAFGVSPRWVDTMQVAELWAVHMALQTVPLPSELLLGGSTW